MSPRDSTGHAVSASTQPRQQADVDLPLSLRMDEQLWRLPLDDALDQVLLAAQEYLGTDQASVWLFTEDARSMHCIARREKIKGRVRPTGTLAAANYPSYFEAVRREAVIAVDDACQDPRTAELAADYLIPLNIGAMLDGCLYHRGRMRGVVCFEQFQSMRLWTDTERQLAQGVSNLLSQLFENDELHQHNELLQLLNELTPELGKANSVHQFSQLALDVVTRQFPDAVAAFFTYAEGSSEAELVDSLVGKAQTCTRIQIRQLGLEQGMCQLAWERQAIVRVPDYEISTELSQDLLDRGMQNNIGSSVAIPLVYDGHTLACIVLLSAEALYFDDRRLRSYQTIAHTLSVGYANSMALEDLRYRALHDSLTGLGNRDRFHEDCHALHELDRTLCLVDLRDFKQVNETFGRSTGDRILTQLAGRLLALADQYGGQAYRLSGSEFALLFLQSGDDEEVRQLAAVLQAGVAQHVNANGVQLSFACTIGVAYYPEHGTDSHSHLRAADIAMSLAKLSGQELRIYDMDSHSNRPRNLELLTELRQAIAREEFSLVYQPKVNMNTGEPFGCEVLLRWENHRFGMVPPDQFIPLAETANLMGPITRWVVQHSLRDLCRFDELGFNLQLAINISSVDLADENFAAELSGIVSQVKVIPSRVSLEITETALMQDPEKAGKAIQALSEHGFAFEVDDFGTGHSSLARLRNLPLRALKIDRTFISELRQNHQDQVIVRSTVGLGHGLGLKVIAEGVEDAPTYTLLSELGCDAVQGYYLSKPLSAPEMLHWLRQQKKQKSDALNLR